MTTSPNGPVVRPVTPAMRWGRRVDALLAVGAVAVLGAALARELSRPRDAREWHGTVLGVPYELRPPTLSRMRERLWSPADPRVLTPTLFGAGWTVNLGRVARLALRR